MLKYYFVTDTSLSLPNPGDILICKGIEYLIDQYEYRRGNDFIRGYISLFNKQAQVFERALDDADCIVMCGAPQFNKYGPSKVFDNVFEFYIEAKSRNIKLVNLYCGFENSFHPDLEDRYKRYSDKLDTIKDIYSVFDLIICRDPTGVAMLNKVDIESTMLLGSSIYSPLYYGIYSSPKIYNAISIVPTGWDLSIEEQKEFWMDVAGEHFGNEPVYYLSHTTQDYTRTVGMLPSAIAINDPRSLLEFYSRAKKVLSLRTHGSAPALALGARVMNLAIDGRHDILKYAGIDSVYFPQFLKDTTPMYRSVNLVKKRQVDQLVLFNLLDQMWGN